MAKLSKASKVYIALMIVPFVLLILTSLLQFAIRYNTSAVSNKDATTSLICPDVQTGSDTVQVNVARGAALACDEEFNQASQIPSENEAGQLIANIITLVVGIISVFLLLLTPVWIILLVMDIKKNKQQLPPRPPSQFPPQQ